MIETLYFKYMFLLHLYLSAPASEYESDDVEVGKCGYAACLCDTELVRCMEHHQNLLNFTHSSFFGYRTTNPGACAITGNILI